MPRWSNNSWERWGCPNAWRFSPIRVWSVARRFSNRAAAPWTLRWKRNFRRSSAGWRTWFEEHDKTRAVSRKAGENRDLPLDWKCYRTGGAAGGIERAGGCRGRFLRNQHQGRARDSYPGDRLSRRPGALDAARRNRRPAPGRPDYGAQRGRPYGMRPAVTRPGDRWLRKAAGWFGPYRGQDPLRPVCRAAWSAGAGTHRSTIVHRHPRHR